MNGETRIVDSAYEYSMYILKNAKHIGRLQGIIGTLGGLWIISKIQERKKNKANMEPEEEES